MGLSSFPNTVSEGVLPILIVNTALSFAILKNILRSILQIVGISPNSEPEFIDPGWTHPQDNPSSPVEFVASAYAPEVHLIAEEIRNSLPIRRFQYEEFVSHDETENHDDGGHVECSVCLSRFEEGDEIRQLPCHHFFHSSCLDKWLDHQTTCPLCRSYLITQDISMRLMEHELTDEHISWYSSFQEPSYHGMWIEG